MLLNRHNIISLPLYCWEYFSVPMCLTQTRWYSLSRSYSTSVRRGRCRTEKGGTYSCLLLTILYPTSEGWCQATALVMHITEAETQRMGFFLSALVCVFVALHFKHLSCDIILFHEPVYSCESVSKTLFPYWPLSCITQTKQIKSMCFTCNNGAFAKSCPLGYCAARSDMLYRMCR